MNAPAISVVMSVNNGEAYLAEAVDSILGQTFRNFEFVIIDDGSKDGTARILEGYAKHDARVRVITQDNRGRVSSLNRGMEIAQAPLIARMDADDVALPERFERQVRFLEAHPEIGLLGTAVQLIGPKGQPMGLYKPDTEDQKLREVMMKGCPFRHPTILMRKEIVIAVGGYRKALLDADDYDLWMRMAERTKIANLSDALLRYRTHPAQVSVTNMRHQTLCRRAVVLAAVRRRSGAADPLDSVTEITLEFVRSLGVRDEEIRNDMAAAHHYWISMLADVSPDTSLSLLDGFVQMKAEGPVNRAQVADALFVGARIRMRRGHVAEALSLGLQGLMIHPMAAGRVAKMVQRRARDFCARVLRGSAA
jgi:glycosyltransferase involved in cell wall biosynthesis